MRIIAEQGSFENALTSAKRGFAIRRGVMAASNQFIMMQKPDEHSANTQAYLYVTDGKNRTPWTPTQSDLMAEDWEMLGS